MTSSTATAAIALVACAWFALDAGRNQAGPVRDLTAGQVDDRDDGLVAGSDDAEGAQRG